MKKGFHKYYNKEYDLTNCEDEPLHLIKYVQSYGALVITDTRIESVLANTDESIVARISSVGDLEALFTASDWQKAKTIGGKSFMDMQDKLLISMTDGNYNVLIHPNEDYIIWEFEPSGGSGQKGSYIDRLNEAISKVSEQNSISEVLETALDEVSAMLGYDHMMLYRFDEKKNGSVISERLNGSSASYLHLKFPASDIPAQARIQFVKERVRMIADSGSVPRALLTVNKENANREFDLTHVTCRAVSPIHIQYLQNMGVTASLSCAIVQDGELWGLIMGHHKSPVILSYKERRWLVMLSNVISSFTTVFRNQELYKAKLNTNAARLKLLDTLQSRGNLNQIMKEQPRLLQNMIVCDGIIIRERGAIFTHGHVPGKESIIALINYFSVQPEFSLFHHHGLANHTEELKEYKDLAGIIALEISKSKSEYIIWTRQPLDQVVNWGGNPKKAKSFNETIGRLEPRGSFALWKEQTKGYSREWSTEELGIIEALRKDIDEFFYKKYDELNALYSELENSYKLMESFSYSVSHDLKASVRSITGYAKILKEDFAMVLDQHGTGLIEVIISSANKMNEFIEDILTFSKTQNAELRFDVVDLDEVYDEVMNDQKLFLPPNLHIAKNTIGNVYGDRIALLQLISNLLSNAIKYSSGEENPEIHINSADQGNYIQVEIKDNGIGFDMVHATKIFEAFKRLVRDDEYEGTGIGLAIVSRVIQVHNGTIRASSNPGKGASFIFTLPKSKDAMRG